MVVTVRLFAGARAAAGGVSQVAVDPVGETVDHALRAVVHDHPGLHRVLPACSFLVDGTRATAGTSLDDGAVLDVLPPFSGG